MNMLKEVLDGLIEGMRRSFTRETFVECFKNYFNPVRHWRQMKGVKSAKKA